MLDLRSAQLDLRDQELKTREREAELSSKSWLRKLSDPLVLAVLGAALGLIANLVSGLMQSRQARDLEAEKGRAGLIQEFIKTGDPQKAKENLKFLLASGILTDPEGKIAKALERNPAISLPSPVSISGPDSTALGEHANSLSETDAVINFARASGILRASDAESGVICTAVALYGDVLLTADHCVHETRGVGMTFSGVGPKGGSRSARIVRVVEENPSLDYALLQTEPTDPPLISLTTLKTRAPQLNEPLAIISAPGGGDLRVYREAPCHVSLVVGDEFAHGCMTQPGSAGGILIALRDEAIVGLHVKKLISQGTFVDYATRFDSIVSASKFIASRSSDGQRRP